MKRTLISIGCAMGPSGRKVPGRSTERCERDSLRVVLRVSNSNEIPERTAMNRARQRTSRLAHTVYHLSMSRPRPESADSDTRDHSVAADVLLRQEPDEEEDEEEEEERKTSVTAHDLYC
jgi:hypothetical protein